MSGQFLQFKILLVYFISRQLELVERIVQLGAATFHYGYVVEANHGAAGLATIAIIEEEGLVEHAAELGAHALGRLEDLKHHHPVIGDVRGRGFLMGIELVSSREGKEPADDLAEDVFYRCLEAGLSFKVSMGSTLTLTPPLIVTAEQMEFALGVLDRCIGEAARARGLA